MKRLLAVVVGMMLGLMLPLSVHSADYDVVILNGRVMDPETNFDGIRNVGIKGGKIAVITLDKIEGKEAIDAKGLVVAPGFIDGHQPSPMDFGGGVPDSQPNMRGNPLEQVESHEVH